MAVYLDNSATTKPCREAVEAITRTLTENYANPSSLHGAGVEAAAAHFLGGAGDDDEGPYDATGVKRRADDGRQRRKGEADADL